MFNAIDLRKMRNAVYLQFMGQLITLVQDSDPVKLKLEGKLAQLQSYYDSFDKLFILPRAKKLSKGIIELDLRRDDAVVGMSQVISGNTHSYIPEKAAAAKLLEAHMNRYGKNINELPYQDESSMVTNLIKDWESDSELSQALVTLELVPWKEELSQSNKDFISRYIARTKEIADDSDDNLKKIRVDFNQAYYTLLKWAESFATVDNTGMYVTLIRQINAQIDQFNRGLESRGGGDDEDPID